MLSGSDIQNIFPECNILRYEDLVNYDDIEEVIHKQGLCLLYPVTSNEVGHWCCLFRNPIDNKIYFFDSYGKVIDDQLDFRTDEYKNSKEWKNRWYRHLTEMLYESSREIDYNPYQFQRDDPNITTCGYWCLARLSLPHLTADQFQVLFRPGLDLDDLVVAYVNTFLVKDYNEN